MRNRIPVRFIAFLAMAMAGAVERASAALVTFQFSGKISIVDDSSGILGGGVQVGDAFTGTLVYDDSTIDLDSDPTIGTYLYANRLTNTPFVAPLGLTVQVGAKTIQPNYANAFGIDVRNDVFSPELNVVGDGFFATQVTSFDGTTFINGSRTYLAFFDRTNTAFSSDALPSSLSTSRFTDGIFRVTVLGPGATSPTVLEGELTLATVPEPGAATLLACGLGGLAFAGLRRKKSA